MPRRQFIARIRWFFSLPPPWLEKYSAWIAACSARRSPSRSWASSSKRGSSTCDGENSLPNGRSLFCGVLAKFPPGLLFFSMVIYPGPLPARLPPSLSSHEQIALALPMTLDIGLHELAQHLRSMSVLGQTDLLERLSEFPFDTDAKANVFARYIGKLLHGYTFVYPFMSIKPTASPSLPRADGSTE